MLTLYLIGLALLAGAAYTLGHRDGHRRGVTRGARLGRLSFFQAAEQLARERGNADSAEAAREMATAARASLRRK